MADYRDTGVELTPLDRGAQIADVRAYGADDTGVADCDAAVTAAGAKGVPFFGPGEYRVSEAYDIWAVPFRAAGEGVTLHQGASSYDISGSFLGEFCYRPHATFGAGQALGMVVSAKTGRTIIRFANHSSNSQSHVIELPLDVRRDSHSVIFRPDKTSLNTCDVLWTRAVPEGSENLFMFVNDPEANGGIGRFLLSVNRAAKGAAVAFGTAMQIPYHNSGPIDFPELQTRFRQLMRFWARTGGNDGTMELRVDHEGSLGQWSMYGREVASPNAESPRFAFAKDQISVSGLQYPALDTPLVGAGSVSNGPAGNFAITFPGTPVDTLYSKEFYTHTDGHVAIIGRLIVAYAHTTLGETGYKEIRVTYFGNTSATPTNTVIAESDAADEVTAEVTKSGDTLSVNVQLGDGTLGGGGQITGRFEWTLARRRPVA